MKPDHHTSTPRGIATTITDPSPLPQRLFSIPHTPNGERQLLTFAAQVISEIIHHSRGTPAVTVQNMPSGCDTVARRSRDTPDHGSITIPFETVMQRLLNVRSLLPDDAQYTTCPDTHVEHPDLQQDGRTLIKLRKTKLQVIDLALSETSERLALLADHTSFADSQRRAFSTISQTIDAIVFNIVRTAKRHS